MTIEAQSLLRKSLYDVCRLRKRQFVGFIVLFFAELGCISWLGRVSESHPLDVPKLVLASMFFVLFSLVYVGMANAWLLSFMTTKILKAIELSSKD